MQDRHDATLEKHRYLCHFGNLIVTKECEFQQSFSQTKKYKSKITHDELLNEICKGMYFGTVIFDVRVPDHLKNKFAEMPPIF